MPPPKQRSYVSQRTIDDLWPRMQAAGEPAREWGARPWRERIGVIALCIGVFGLMLACVSVPISFAAFTLGRSFPSVTFYIALGLFIWLAVVGALLIAEGLALHYRILGGLWVIYLPLPVALTLISPDPRFLQGVMCAVMAIILLLQALPRTEIQIPLLVQRFISWAAHTLCIVALGVSLLYILPVGVHLYAAFQRNGITSFFSLMFWMLYLVRSVSEVWARPRRK